jgi:aspartate 1-decarboxylase
MGGAKQESGADMSDGVATATGSTSDVLIITPFNHQKALELERWRHPIVTVAAAACYIIRCRHGVHT